MSSAIAWFEIPVTDLDRAQAFYEAVMAAPLRREAMGPSQGAVFPYAEPGVGGALMCGPASVPTGESSTGMVALRRRFASAPSTGASAELRKSVWPIEPLVVRVPANTSPGPRA